MEIGIYSRSGGLLDDFLVFCVHDSLATFAFKNIQKINVIVEGKNKGRTDSFAKVSLNKDYPSGKMLNMIIVMILLNCKL